MPVFNVDRSWFPMPTLQQGSPLGGVLSDAISKRLAMANAQLAEAKVPFASQLEQALASKSQQEAQWYGPKIRSDIGLQGAQAGLAGSEAAKNRFLVANPEFYSPEGMLIHRALQQQGNGNNPVQLSTSLNDTLSQNAPPAEVRPSSPLSDSIRQLISPPASTGMTPARGNGQGGMTPWNPQAEGNAQAPQETVQQQQQYDPNALAFNPPQLPSPTGNQQLDNMYWNKYGMNPVIKQQLDLSTDLAKQYNKQNLDRNVQLGVQAQAANDSSIQANSFLDALNDVNSLMTGPLGSRSPAFTDASQRMDNASANMVSAASRMFQNAGHITDSDITLQSMAKTGRNLNPDVAFDVAQGLLAKNSRIKEQQQFYSIGTSRHLRPDIMDALWNRYETERQYFNPNTHMPNDSYRGSFMDYLTPAAVNAITQGREYTPPNQKYLDQQNWTKDNLSQAKSWARKHGMPSKYFEKRNIYTLAKNSGMTLAQFKEYLRSKGAFE